MEYRRQRDIVEVISNLDREVNRLKAALARARVTDLDDLGDVVITAPATRHALIHNGSGWVNRLLIEADISNLQAYALVGHNHDATYSAIAHNHDATYAAIAHVGAGGAAHANAVAAGAAGFMTGADKTKLDGIESGATGDQTANEILTAIKTVDGAGSGLDADLLDGSSSAAFALLAGATFSGVVQTPGGSSTAPGLAVGEAGSGVYLQATGRPYVTGVGELGSYRRTSTAADFLHAFASDQGNTFRTHAAVGADGRGYFNRFSAATIGLSVGLTESASTTTFRANTAGAGVKDFYIPSSRAAIKTDREAVVVDDALAKVRRLLIERFRWTEEVHVPEGSPLRTGVKDWGLIAEQVAEVEPLWADYRDDGTPGDISERRLLVAALASIQALAAEVARLKKQLATR